MKWINLLLGVAALAGIAAITVPGRLQADQAAASISLTKIPSGFRDWRLISVAREEGSLDDIRAILGNDKAINAYRGAQLPFPDGTIIARIAWNYVPSEENNKVFGRSRSFVAAPPRTSGLWLRTQRNTPRRVAGGSLNLRTANLPAKQRSGLAFRATNRSKLATLSSHRYAP